MGILSGNPKEEPMHYGEVYTLWNYALAAKGKVASFQAMMNHVGDRDLKKLMEDMSESMKDEIKQVEDILRENGIASPPTTAERPKVNLVGARFTDPEIAVMVGADISAGLIACSTIIGQSIREDIGMMFGQFHASRMVFAGKSLRMNKEKGWLVPPPLHVQTAEPVHA
ncbi:DUF3231 family protein [Marinicrinis lubricantis]|uniref:DUF3231 family protein n=1 Tax=Marinicrinis lubricantis TaxID=2086470 RepID=A0ABW1IQL5_9BACL